MNSDQVDKFGIVIIESLPDNEKKTGHQLFNSTIRFKGFEFRDLDSEFYDVNNRMQLFELFDDLVRKALEENHFFILHIEMHGYSDGVELKNEEKVNWGELIPYFRKINIHYHNYLFIVLGVCKGAGIIKYINPAERSPFRALISSEKDIYEYDLMIGFEEFYKHFLFELDSIEALEKYNTVIDNPEDRLLHVTSDYIFDNITDIDRETLDLDKLKRTYRENLFRDYPLTKYFSEEHNQRFIMYKLRQMFDELKENRDYFLMKDLDQFKI